MLNNLMQNLPQVLEVIGNSKTGNLMELADNYCKSQNIPFNKAKAQAQGIINLLGGEQKTMNILRQFGLKL